MSEKATGRPWRVDPENNCDVQSGDGAIEIATTHPLVLRTGKKPSGDIPARNAELIVKAVNNYDELASIARDMAGAIEKAGNRIKVFAGEGLGPDPILEHLAHVLSRYTAFMEGEE